MVQTQRMKVLLYASLYSIDSVILQLKWDFLMAGVMPFLSLCGLSYWIASGFRRRRQGGWRRRMVRALAEVDRFLNHNSQEAITRKRSRSGPLHLGLLNHSDSRELLRDPADSITPGHHRGGGGGGQQVLGQPPRLTRSWTERSLGATGTDMKAAELEKVGAALGHLDSLCWLASHVRLEATDWRAFRRDVLDLTSPELSSQQKLHVVATMRCTYHVFHAGA